MEAIPEPFYRVSIKALILNETRDKFLIIQEENGNWDFPGGGLYYGESPKECLKREIKEEMGLDVVSIGDAPLYFITGQLQRKDVKGKWYSNVFYEVILPDLDFSPSNECVSIKFVTAKEAAVIPAYNSVISLSKLFKKS